MDRRLFLAALPALGLSACVKKDEVVATTGLAKALIEAAHRQTESFVLYDSKYTKIGYPNGDVPLSRGVCADVVIRAYRAIGIDLQALVHEDMAAHFDLYPKRWGLKGPDPNIDHRRVPNLMVFFSRFGKVLPMSQDPKAYQPGDLITNRPGGGTHIAVVSDVISPISGRLMVIQNCGFSTRQDDDLLRYPLLGHYRYRV
ncbi:DUF1287 domain-containing protein [Asticcacaulis solisilvae]|uniref:DUF1287 domain-containing protein n=1 Tax=Asticcacaulis solisilvae TaxID=1217274 RepID=UPI003FD7AA6E